MACCFHAVLFPLSHPGFLYYTSVWGPLAWVSSDPKTKAQSHRTGGRHHSRAALVRLAVHGPELQCVWNAEQRAFAESRLSQLSAAVQVSHTWKNQNNCIINIIQSVFTLFDFTLLHENHQSPNFDTICLCWWKRMTWAGNKLQQCIVVFETSSSEQNHMFSLYARWWPCSQRQRRLDRQKWIKYLISKSKWTHNSIYVDTHVLSCTKHRQTTRRNERKSDAWHAFVNTDARTEPLTQKPTTHSSYVTWLFSRHEIETQAWSVVLTLPHTKSRHSCSYQILGWHQVQHVWIDHR